jgi:hypothetical protein
MLPAGCGWVDAACISYPVVFGSSCGSWHWGLVWMCIYSSQAICVEVDWRGIKLSFILFHFNTCRLEWIHIYQIRPDEWGRLVQLQVKGQRGGSDSLLAAKIKNEGPGRGEEGLFQTTNRQMIQDCYNVFHLRDPVFFRLIMCLKPNSTGNKFTLI